MTPSSRTPDRRAQIQPPAPRAAEEGQAIRLQPCQMLPSKRGWAIDQGYLRMVSWTGSSDLVTIGIWGPGDLVIPSLIDTMPVELSSISTARVMECEPEPAQEQQFLIDHLQQISSLLVINRVRPVEDRLFQLLLWLAERFGKVSSRGITIPIEEMGLTHRQLAEITGTTRVSITKCLTRFRQLGAVIREGEQEVLPAGQACLRQRGDNQN